MFNKLVVISVFLISKSALAQVPHPECKTGGKMRDGVFDCGGITISAEKACPGNAEGQKPILQLWNATVKNVVLDGKAGGDGIHCRGGECTLDNVTWEDICEDAATLDKEGKKMTIIDSTAYNDRTGPGGSPDKIFQHNSINSTIVVKDSVFTGVQGKLWRSCGNCTDNGGPRYLVVNNVRIEGQIDSIAGPNKNFGDTVTISNLGIKNYKDGDPKICVTYTGVEYPDPSPKGEEEWDTETCKVSKKDITPL